MGGAAAGAAAGAVARARRRLVSHFMTQNAVSAERLRIARELHDIVAHSVTVMVLHAAGAKRVVDTDPDRAK